MSRIDFSFLCLFMIQLFDLNLLVESSNANMSPWKDACDWYVRGGCEVCESYASEESVTEMQVGGKSD